MLYTFIDSTFKKTTVEFNTCNDADLYISKNRNEQLQILSTTPQPELNIDQIN